MITCISSSLWGQNIEGYYASNAAVLGFFVTRIQLNPDSTFKYEFAGDLQYDYGTGRYKFVESTVHLQFDAIEDTSYVIKAFREVHASNRPSKYLLRGNKLWSYHVEQGHVVKQGQALSRRRKFLFFGDHYLTKRRIYLEKIPHKELLWRFEEASR